MIEETKLKQIKTTIDNLEQLVFFLMPIRTELTEDDIDEIEEKTGEHIIAIDEPSYETMEASRRLKFASRWIGIENKKKELEEEKPERMSDDVLMKIESLPVLKEEHVSYQNLPYEEKVKYLIFEILNVKGVIEKSSIEEIFSIQDRIKDITKYLSEAVFLLEWELQRYEDEKYLEV